MCDTKMRFCSISISTFDEQTKINELKKKISFYSIFFASHHLCLTSLLFLCDTIKKQTVKHGKEEKVKNKLIIVTTL